MRNFRDAFLQRVPGLAAAVGRRRFERYVARPVPAHVTDVSAGFDLDLTLFRLEPPFERGNVLRAFEPAGKTAWTVHRILLGEHVGEPTRQFYRVARPELTAVWLYLNDGEGRGAVLTL